MPLMECIERHTHRQYRLWMDYLDAEWDIHSRTDNYLMQIAMEVKRVLSGKPSLIKLKDFVLSFVSDKPKPEVTEEQKQQKVKWFKSQWLARLTGKKRDGKRS